MNWFDRAIGAVAPGAGLRRARQRQMIAVLARAYEGARQGRRTEGWIAAGTGANAEIAPALARLRDRSRDLVRNNPYAGKAVQALVSNMVGTGLDAAGARGGCRRLPEQADRLWLGLRRRRRRRRAHGLRRPAGADRAQPRRERRGAGAAAGTAHGGRAAGAAATAGVGGRPPRQLEDWRTRRRRLHPAGHRVRRPRPPARLLALSDPPRRRPRWRWSRIGFPPTASCTSSSGCGPGRCAACRGSRR